MKTFVASLAIAAVLCVIMLFRTAYGQANWICNSESGCPFVSCVSQSGTCPAGGPNAGIGYTAVKELTRTVWTCDPRQGPGCQTNVMLNFCTVTGYTTINMAVCSGELCTFNTQVLGCTE